MKLSRRQFLHLAAGTTALPVVPGMGSAQTYPARPVRLILGFPPGGAADIVARLVSQALTERFGQPFVVESRPGAASNIAAEAVAHATPDGYTLLHATASNAFNATLYEKLSFNFVRDMAPVAGLTRGAFVMVVNPSFAAKSVPEFVAYAKAKPGMINMSSSGTGTGPHIAGEMFKKMAGIDMTHVPYRGGAPAITALLGNQVQVYFSPLPEPIEYVRAGKLRALSVTTATRIDTLPDVPAMGEFVPGYELSGWQGIVAPKKTPAEIIDRLNREINATLSESKMKKRLADLGVTTLQSSSAEFGKFIADETAKYGNVIRAAGIRME